MNAGAKRQRRTIAWMVLICAVIASLAVAVAPAAAEESDSAPLMSGGGFGFPDITGPAAPEEYPFQIGLNAEQTLRQVSETEAWVEYVEGPVAFKIRAPEASDAVGATVPTTLRVTEGDIVTMFVHYRAGNPAAGWAPFAFPIVDGAGWPGGYRTTSVEINGPLVAPTTETAPAPTCTVPSLHGLNLRAAKSRLRAADCAIGLVHLAAGASAGKGKVLKQFRPAGTQLAAGAPIAVKLGSGGRG